MTTLQAVAGRIEEVERMMSHTGIPCCATAFCATGGGQGGTRLLIPRTIEAGIAVMTPDSTFRAFVIASIALCLPVGLYYRIRSQASGERLRAGKKASSSW